MEKWIRIARELGFETAKVDVKTLKSVQMVRDACASDQCCAYGKNWTCPPYCGTLAQCEEKMHSYASGILLQTVGQLNKTIDSKGYARVEREHLQKWKVFTDLVREEYPDALCLGSGGCRICETCAWPEPCRFPEKAQYSMEAYGLFVTQVCRDCGAQYYHGPKTITYCALILF